MKNKILFILFVLITNFVQAATIYVNVDNVNGSSVSGAYVKLYNNTNVSFDLVEMSQNILEILKT